ncbi:MAG: heparinase II/III family protein [Candidatus Eisenbacteria bacterium]
MNPFLLPHRAFGRIRRRLEARRHSQRDALLLARWREELGIDARALDEIEERWGDVGPLADAPLLQSLLDARMEATRAWAHTAERAEVLRAAIDAAERGGCRPFGHEASLDTPGGYSFDWLRRESWPLRPHAEIRLDQPNRAGDVRMVWEAARFHHALLLPLGGRLDRSTSAARVRGFDGTAREFLRQNPPFHGVHWAVGMEVAIRAAAWLFAEAAWPRDRAGVARGQWLIESLLLHGLFLETHLERHPSGFTTNHTLSDHAGLALLGRAFAAWPVGQRWLGLASRGLSECLREQVLESGAHFEASLAYERYVLEAALIGLLALDPAEQHVLRPSLRALGAHLEGAMVAGRLPAIGDADESFFPPFAILPYAERDPFDPAPLLAVLREAVGTDDTRALASDARGLLRIDSPPFEAVMVHRAAGDGFVATHGHNDLLSLCLAIDGEMLVIDPGTGGYGFDRALRHQLRSTTAHSTVSLEREEQRPLRARATFEGPSAPPGGRRVRLAPRLEVEAWHDGMPGVRHRRRITRRGPWLLIEDELEPRDESAPPRARHSCFKLQLSVDAQVELLAPRHARVLLRQGTAELLLLRPRGAGWQIRPRTVSERYAEVREAPALEVEFDSPWPHRFRIAIRRSTVSIHRDQAGSIPAR